MSQKRRLILYTASFTMAASGLTCSLSAWWVSALLAVLGPCLALFTFLMGKGEGVIRTRPPQFVAVSFLKISEEERRLSAFHEAAHCVAAWFNPNALEPVQVRVAREVAGEEIPAYTAYLPESVNTESQLRAQITVALAGAAVDLTNYGERTTGYAHDLAQATDRARTMVLRFAMGELTPFRSFDLGARDFDDATAGIINKAICGIMEQCRDEARRLVSERRAEIAKVAAEVVRAETLEAEDIAELLGPRPKRDV